MRFAAIKFVGLIALLSCAPAQAGLYNTAELPIPLEPSVDKFLERLKEVRSYSPPDGRNIREESAGRTDYLKKVEALRQKQKNSGRLIAEESANLGAYLIRLRMTRLGGIDLQEAQDVLQAAAEQYPRDFYVQSNFATLHQLMGNYDLAERALERAEDLAPNADQRRLEHYQLLLIRQRSAERSGQELALDRLFPIRFVGESGQWEVGKIAAAEAAKLPGGIPGAKRVVQQLLVWFPMDGRLYWLLGELANAEGDTRGAFLAMDWAVHDARLSGAELRDHRSRLKVLNDQRIAEQEAKINEEQKRAAELIGGGPVAPPVPAPPTGGALAEMTWRGWLIVAGGAVVILGLLALQVREILRRRKRPATASSRTAS